MVVNAGEGGLVVVEPHVVSYGSVAGSARGGRAGVRRLLHMVNEDGYQCYIVWWHKRSPPISKSIYSQGGYYAAITTVFHGESDGAAAVRIWRVARDRNKRKRYARALRSLGGSGTRLT